MEQSANAINWFEIPATDIDRARGFYQQVMEIEMKTSEMMGMHMAFFPYEMGSGKVSGALCKSEMHKPSHDGVIIYLNANPDLQQMLDRVEEAGGQVVMPKTQISPEIGYMAFFIDSEGNKMALHSQQ